MELRNEEEQEKKTNGKKAVFIALVTTVILAIIVSILILVLKQVENNKLKLIVDGKTKTVSEQLILADSEEIYLSISQIAKLVGYEYYNGEYKQYSEDKTKCYVECADELAMLELNSNIIYKNNSADKLNFDAYTINKEVKNYNGELYATTQAIQTAFNTRVVFEESNNTLYIETLKYLVEYYNSQVIKKGYIGLAEDFITQKALVKNLLVVNKDQKYGVLSAKDFSTVIGNKYDKIIYLENTQEFIVTNDEKTGILSVNGNVKIGLRYDEVGLIDGNEGLYYAKNDELYGVINKNGKVLVYVAYDKIGIDKTVFPLDNIKNNMFLYNNCIPLKRGTKWGIADKNGSIILDFEYDNLGYISEDKSTSNADISINNVVVIPEVEGIVIGKQNKYGVANSIGKIIIPCEFDKIYSITSEGKDEFYLEKNGKTIKLTKYLEDNKVNVDTINKIDITVNDKTNQTNNSVTRDETLVIM